MVLHPMPKFLSKQIRYFVLLFSSIRPPMVYSSLYQTFSLHWLNLVSHLKTIGLYTKMTNAQDPRRDQRERQASFKAPNGKQSLFFTIIASISLILCIFFLMIKLNSFWKGQTLWKRNKEKQSGMKIGQTRKYNKRQ